MIKLQNTGLETEARRPRHIRRRQSIAVADERNVFPIADRGELFGQFKPIDTRQM